MNKFSTKIKKLFCFALSISLIFSNVNVFAQNMSLPSTRQLVKDDIWPLLVNELEPALTDVQVAYDNLLYAVQTEDVAKYQQLITEYKTKLNDASRIYSRYKGHYNAYDAFLTSEQATSEVARLARQYEKAGEELPQYFVLEKDIVFAKLQSEVDWLERLSNREISKMVMGIDNEMPYLQESLLNRFHYQDMIDFHKLDMKAYLLDSKSANYIREHIKPGDVLEYAYKHLNPQARAGVNLNLRLHNNPEEILSLVSGIRRYTRDFRQKVPGFVKTMKAIRSMNFAARENYLLTEVTTNLTAGNTKLIKDIEKFQTKAKFPFVKKLFQSGPMVIVASAIVALTVTTVAAGNNFSEQSITPGNFAKVQTAIENNDPNLTVDNLLSFYDSDRADALIANDIGHALTFANIALSEQEMENVMELWEQKRQEESQAETESNQRSVRTSLNNNDWNSTKNYGVGTI